MSGLNYPDHFYADSQKPTGAYDARKLREETIAIAQSQDRDNDCLVSILAAWRAVRKQQDDVYARLVKLAERKPLPEQYDLRQGERPSWSGDVPAEQVTRVSAATHESPPKWSPEWGIPHTQRKGYSQGTVTSGSARILQNGPPNCDGHNPSGSTAPSGYVRWVERDTNPHPKSVGSQHPMQAEAIHIDDEKPGDLL